MYMVPKDPLHLYISIPYGFGGPSVIYMHVYNTGTCSLLVPKVQRADSKPSRVSRVLYASSPAVCSLLAAAAFRPSAAASHLLLLVRHENLKARPLCGTAVLQYRYYAIVRY